MVVSSCSLSWISPCLSHKVCVLIIFFLSLFHSDTVLYTHTAQVHVLYFVLFQLNLPHTNCLPRNIATSSSNTVFCELDTTPSGESKNLDWISLCNSAWKCVHLKHSKINDNQDSGINFPSKQVFQCLC